MRQCEFSLVAQATSVVNPWRAVFCVRRCVASCCFSWPVLSERCVSEDKVGPVTRARPPSSLRPCLCVLGMQWQRTHQSFPPVSDGNRGAGGVPHLLCQKYASGTRLLGPEEGRRGEARREGT